MMGPEEGNGGGGGRTRWNRASPIFVDMGKDNKVHRGRLIDIGWGSRVTPLAGREGRAAEEGEDNEETTRERKQPWEEEKLIQEILFRSKNGGRKEGGELWLNGRKTYWEAAESMFRYQGGSATY
ncbi:unnamed protein product [Arctogadus glacialis]